MSKAVGEPTVKAVVVLDQDGNRLHAKYYDPESICPEFVSPESRVSVLCEGEWHVAFFCHMLSPSLSSVSSGWPPFLAPQFVANGAALMQVINALTLVLSRRPA